MSETVTMTLTEFLLARIAEDEEVAREARGHEYLDASRDSSVIHWECDASSGYAFVTTTSGRILAECEAKRRIVEHHQHSGDPANADRRFPGNAFFCEACMNEDDRWCLTLRALARVYADHPDYREEWKP